MPVLPFSHLLRQAGKKDLKNQLEGVQRRNARFVCKNSRQKASVTDMISSLGWESLEHRRAAQRLTLIYKSVNKLVAIDTDPYQSVSSRGVSTRAQGSSSFVKLSAHKDCYKYSLFPRTFAEWNCLPPSIRDAPTVSAFKTGLNSVGLEEVISRAHFSI